MDRKRGISFILGLAALFLTYRLYQQGILHDLGIIASHKLTGTPLVGGELDVDNLPGLLAAVLVESVIFIGTVVGLLLTGAAQVLQYALVWLKEGLAVVAQYFSLWRKDQFDTGEEEEDKDKDKENNGEVNVEVNVTAPQTPAKAEEFVPRSFEDLVVLTMKSNRDSVNDLNEKFDSLAGMIEDLSNTVKKTTPATTKPKPRARKTGTKK